MSRRYGQMGVDVTKEREEITVHTMNPGPRRGPVFYAYLPCDTETRRGQGTYREEAKHRLVSTLWEHLVARDNPLWQRGQSPRGAAYPTQVTCGLHGRPHLLLGDYRGPAISFSEGGGKIWAALAGDDSALGIDAAGTDEFQGEYPVHRVFHPEELEHALRLAGGDVAEASALLWSVKEAVVKALGCAFHLVDPRHIIVYPSAEGQAGEGGGYSFPVGLSGKALLRFPRVVGRALLVRSLSQRKLWLSIAQLEMETGES